MLSPREIEYISKARVAIETLGWVVDEELYDNDEAYVVFTRDSERTGWGRFHQLYCWTEAYEAITGQPWGELVKHLHAQTCSKQSDSRGITLKVVEHTDTRLFHWNNFGGR